MAHVAAKNIGARIRSELPGVHGGFEDIPAVCIMDAHNNGSFIHADEMLPPRKHGVFIPQAHAMTLAFEKYFLWKARHGYVTLP